MQNLEECLAAQKQHEEGAPEGLEGAQEPRGGDSTSRQGECNSGDEEG